MDNAAAPAEITDPFVVAVEIQRATRGDIHSDGVADRVVVLNQADGGAIGDVEGG